ncbi:hypothetical protein [Mesorhizobium sp. M1399]|uniref:hypothetical protein n=1 Tax=Mesorhizobium sp. M1399 TaxID=2957096 RepID=UPI00333BB1B4
MRHSAILKAALCAGIGTIWPGAAGAVERQLYDYARERKFPPPETLARKASEIAGGDFPFKSLAEAPESARVFFTAFRAVAEALEPFHEPDLEMSDQPEEAAAGHGPDHPYPEPAENTSPLTPYGEVLKRIDDLKKVTDIAVQPGNADADEYMRGMANGLILAVATMDGTEPAYIEPPAKKEETMDDKKEPVDDDGAAPAAGLPAAGRHRDQIDEVEKKRRVAQAETDKVIAESGGKFSEPAPKKNHK